MEYDKDLIDRFLADPTKKAKSIQEASRDFMLSMNKSSKQVLPTSANSINSTPQSVAVATIGTPPPIAKQITGTATTIAASQNSETVITGKRPSTFFICATMIVIVVIVSLYFAHVKKTKEQAEAKYNAIEDAKKSGQPVPSDKLTVEDVLNSSAVSNAKKFLILLAIIFGIAFLVMAITFLIKQVKQLDHSVAT